MLKKLFKIGVLAGALLFTCNANAQEKQYEIVYPQYSFGSNWSIGGSLGYAWELSHGGLFDFGLGTNIGFRLFGEKELNHIFAFRIVGDIPGFPFISEGKSQPAGSDYMLDGNHYDCYGKIGVDFKFDFINAKRGYDPDRKWSTYLFAGMGVSIKRDDVPLGKFGEYLQAGIGAGYKCNDHHYFFAEAYGDICSDVPYPSFHLYKWHDFMAQLAVGYMYMIGPTQEDLDMLAQRAMLTQENFDTKDKEIAGLRNQLKESKNNETKLINRIEELEANQHGGTSGSGRSGNIIVNNNGGDNSRIADSLQKIIDNYETNKYNFYALPFSILYGIDEYTVSEDQMKKIDAIAQVMKENKDVNFEIVGYCDYSGSKEYNQKLSEKRAEHVKKLLVRKGVAENRLTTSGKGKEMSFGDIKNAINRRVSFYRVNK
jgi:outer membrane protein OmpA-like peptidoglycan-associated protein